MVCFGVALKLLFESSLEKRIFTRWLEKSKIVPVHNKIKIKPWLKTFDPSLFFPVLLKFMKGFEYLSQFSITL